MTDPAVGRRLAATAAKPGPSMGRSKLNLVSFRARLTTFFVLIVVLPMVAITLIVVSLTDDSQSGKADARLAEGLVAARALYSDDVAASGDAVRAIARDPGFDAALRTGHAETIQ